LESAAAGLVAPFLRIQRIMHGRVGIAAVMPITKMPIDLVKKRPPWSGTRQPLRRTGSGGKESGKCPSSLSREVDTNLL
jgi:hypothetical protein